MQRFNANGVSHDGVGVHSGRANGGAQNHPTMGCIRTTDEAMEAITRFILGDPLESITVQGNHDQNIVPSPHHGDHHRPHHPAPAGQSAPAGSTNPSPSSAPAPGTSNIPVS
jgi:hypothetical protein